MNSSLRSRRFFLQLLACGGGAAVLAACGGSTTGVELGLSAGFPQGVFSGDPTAASIVLSTRAVPKDGTPLTIPVTLQLSTNANFNTIIQTFPLLGRRTAGSNYRLEPGDYIVRQVVTNLQPGTSYFYRFTLSDGTISPVGSFRTLPANGDSRAIKFLHISCANEPTYPIGAALLRETDVDWLSFNGDTVYADRFWLNQLPTSTLEFYRSLYRDQRNPDYAGAEFPQIFAKFPVVANWDDHEVIDNYSGQAAKGGPATQLDDTTGQTTNVESLKVLGYQAFFEYNPVTPTLTDVQGVNAQERVFRSFRYGANAEVFVLDLRQYRDLAAQTPVLPILPTGLTQDAFLQLAGLTNITAAQRAALFGPPGSEAALRRLLRETPRILLGTPQKNWLLNGLRASTATYKFIITEFPITETFFRSNDVWEGYWLERQEVLDFIETNRIQNVVFLAGNNHAGCIARVNPTRSVPVWEVWTGPTGKSVTATSLNQAGQALGLGNNGAQLYYSIVNAFLAPVTSNPQTSGIPGVTNSSLQFLELAKPNYNTIEVNGGQCTIRIKDSSGNVITDPLGRRGELILPKA